MPAKQGLVIVSTNRIYSEVLGNWLERESGGFRPLLREGGLCVRPECVSDEDVLMIVASDWHQMAEWFDSPRSALSRNPWLLLADLRVSAAFSTFLPTDRCSVLSPLAPCENFWRVLGALVRCRPLCPASGMLDEFHSHFALLDIAEPSSPRWQKLVQCGCAVSLGMTNAQIVATLGLNEATVKTYIHHLFLGLHVEDRRCLAAQFETAAITLSSTLWEAKPSAALPLLDRRREKLAPMRRNDRDTNHWQ